MNKLRFAAAAAILAAAVHAGAEGKEPLKIGALLAVTGPASFLGAPEARTLEMLVEDLNQKGGVDGRRIQLIVKDTAGDPAKAVSFAKQLMEEEKVFAIIGPATSGETLAIKPIVEEGKTLLLSCAAAEVIVNPVAPHVFKVAPKDGFAAEMIFRRMKKMGVKRIGLLSSNTGFGKAGKDQVEKLAPAHGIEIVVSDVYDKAATDLTAEVTKLKAANVQAILNWSIEPAQAIVIKNARQIGLQGSDLPEPRVREHPVREGGRRGRGGGHVPGEPHRRRRRARGRSTRRSWSSPRTRRRTRAATRRTSPPSAATRTTRS